MKNQQTKSRQQTTTVRTRRAIVHSAQARRSSAGPGAGGALLTSSPVRQHRNALQAQRLVTYDENPRPMGRPVKLWQLTPANCGSLLP